MRNKYLNAAVAFLAVFLLQACASSPSESVYEHQVETHPSQGDIRIIQGAIAKLTTTENGISVLLQTNELVPGNVHTMWVAVMNAPEACAQRPCAPPDVLNNTEATGSDVTYADGILVGPDGTGTFRTFIPTGPSGFWWYGNGLQEPMTAEIHLIVNDHGPIIPEMAQSMLTTYRGGCTDESLPPPFPDTAKSNGTPGPNQCKLIQEVIFQQ